GQELLALRGHADKVSSALFSPDGSLLATASHDRTARVWDSRTGVEVTPPREEGAAPPEAPGPDGPGITPAPGLGSRPDQARPLGGYDPWAEAERRREIRAPGWHAAEAAAAEGRGDRFAAAFHLGRLLRLRPAAAALHRRRALALDPLGRTAEAALH